MIASVLIANRGEIACRIIRTAKRLGIRTIAIYSDADRDALHVKAADEAHYIGASPATDSYLASDRIIELARRRGAASIHPGYGFLSENAEFAEECERAGIVFIGPSAAAIRAMGLKDSAKQLMQAAGVPVIPGYIGDNQAADFLAERAAEITYPVLIKAVAGGGGRGMRRIDAAADFSAALASAQREAQSSFGNARVLIEKYIVAPRHIEMQVFGDRHGNAIHLFERDCSMQRRHQKVIEEALAPGMTASLRAKMGRAAIAAAKAVHYVGAGTVEFIVAGEAGMAAGQFYFMEMNTRLQVEHPVTEAITGLDLVEMQFRVAAGEPLPLRQDQVRHAGHAIEARLYAEDPETGFLPSTGRIYRLDLPVGEDIRVDTGVAEGDEISPFYDPMIAKIIAKGDTREAALATLNQALADTIIAGPKTNLRFLRKLCEAPEFSAAALDTGFIDRNLERLGAVEQEPDRVAILAGVSHLVAEKQQVDRARWREARRWSGDPWNAEDAFQLSGLRSARIAASADDKSIEAWLVYAAAQPMLQIPVFESESVLGDEAGRDCHIVPIDDGCLVIRDGRQTEVRLARIDDVDATDEGDGLIKAPMHGKLAALFVAPGDSVAKGARLAIVEAMKMEHPLVAPFDGIVEKVGAVVGAQVAQGFAIIILRAK